MNEALHLIHSSSDQELLNHLTLNPMGPEKSYDLIGGPKGPHRSPKLHVEFGLEKFYRHWKELFKMHQIQSR